MSEGTAIKAIKNYINSSEELNGVLSGMLGSSDNEMTDKEKKRAAYALNMCTVSVSQIIDYDDLNILEQEYEAILNNINLEQMPKDNALLHILRQLLDTITYFRIAEGDKRMIEKEYQQKMKNAIWSAVPNFGMLIAGGDPLTMAISLASQVGIGYMNYRRNKNEYNLDREGQMWQLQRSAIEQFNGLRRELFDTAWRLADKYNFPDEYRLTERQINRYNDILTDKDELRKYERLESIKDKFEAYPPFWYFIGNAANYIAGSESLNISDETKLQYRKKAKEYFEKYTKLNELSVLREDQLAAACALEYIDLLLLEEKPDIEKINALLDKAVNMSENVCDVLEICAIAYLKINNFEKAEKILRILVNENYNRVINAQLLSSIYVRNRDIDKYELLATRVDRDYLYPMPPDDGHDLKQLEAEFGSKQKMVLKQKYNSVLENLVQKYTIAWNKLTSIFELGIDYPEDFFDDSPRAKAERKNKARKVLSDAVKRESYQSRMENSNYELNILGILNELFSALFHFKSFEDLQVQEKAKNEVREILSYKRGDINKLQKEMDDGNFGLNGYAYSQTITLTSIVDPAMNIMRDYAHGQIDIANINDITYMESDLRSFCAKHGLKEPEIAIASYEQAEGLFETNKEIFGPELFGNQAVLAKRNIDFISDMTTFLKGKIEDIGIKGDETNIYFNGEPEFNGYFYNTAFDKNPDVKAHTLMVIKDNTKKSFDLIFTTDGIVNVVKNKVKYLTPYSEAQLKREAIVIYRNQEYKNSAIDLNSLFNIIHELGNKFVRGIESKIEYIDELVTAKLLNKWFKDRPDAMSENVVRMYAIPKKEIIKGLGYVLDEEPDLNYHLLQFYFDAKTKDLLGMRVVNFTKIDSNFQSMVMEKGVLKLT